MLSTSLADPEQERAGFNFQILGCFISREPFRLTCHGSPGEIRATFLRDFGFEEPIEVST